MEALQSTAEHGITASQQSIVEHDSRAQRQSMTAEHDGTAQRYSSA